MQEKIDKLLEVVDELTKKNKEISGQLVKESEKRREMASKLQIIENEVKKNDEENKRKINLSIGAYGFKKLGLENDENSKNNARQETLATEISENEEILRKNKSMPAKGENSITNIDILYFLQCEAAALESYLEENE